MIKYCVKCGYEFDAIGREVICPSCMAAAAEETKRYSGWASTVIRAYGKAHNLPFAQALDALLQASDYVKSSEGWEGVKKIS